MLLQRLSETILLIGVSLALGIAFVLATMVHYGRKAARLPVTIHNQIKTRHKKTNQF